MAWRDCWRQDDVPRRLYLLVPLFDIIKTIHSVGPTTTIYRPEFGPFLVGGSHPNVPCKGGASQLYVGLGIAVVGSIGYAQLGMGLSLSSVD
eukprot:scaffold198562_cov47-Attheya_sp.AAC.2